MGLFFSPEIEKAREQAPAPEGVSLWQLLEVNEECIPVCCRAGAFRIALWWVEAKRPGGKTALSCFLHSALNRCKRDGVRYPKVALLRLKQMQRGEWGPAEQFQLGASRGAALDVSNIVASPEEMERLAERQEERKCQQMADVYRRCDLEIPERYLKGRDEGRKAKPEEVPTWDELMR